MRRYVFITVAGKIACEMYLFIYQIYIWYKLEKCIFQGKKTSIFRKVEFQ